MNLFQLHNVLMLFATIASVIVFFAIQATPSLRSAHVTNPNPNPVPNY